MLQQFAYESCKPLAQWVADLIQRVTFFSGWARLVTAASEKALRSQLIGTYLQRLQMSRSGSDQESPARAWHTQPSSFWLSGFFFPQGRSTLWSYLSYECFDNKTYYTLFIGLEKTFRCLLHPQSYGNLMLEFIKNTKSKRKVAILKADICIADKCSNVRLRFIIYCLLILR